MMRFLKSSQRDQLWVGRGEENKLDNETQVRVQEINETHCQK